MADTQLPAYSLPAEVILPAPFSFGCCGIGEAVALLQSETFILVISLVLFFVFVFLIANNFTENVSGLIGTRDANGMVVGVEVFCLFLTQPFNYFIYLLSLISR